MWIMYLANVLVAGWISFSCLFQPRRAVSTVFGGSLEYSESIRLVGALWGGIFLLSILGLFFPLSMSPIFLMQLLYKGSWLFVVALPALQKGKPFPREMALFFLVWVLILPFVIPWGYLFG